MPRKKPSPVFPEPVPTPAPVGDAVDWTLVQRKHDASSGAVVSGHIALQLAGKNASASELLMAQLVVEIAALREVLASKP